MHYVGTFGGFFYLFVSIVASSYIIYTKMPFDINEYSFAKNGLPTTFV
jgi:hypothetical protein